MKKILTLFFFLSLLSINTFAEEVLHTILEGHTEGIYSVAYSPDGQTLASGSGDNNIRLWNAHTGEHLDTLIGHAHIVYSIAYSPDGQTLASGSGDNNIRLWNTHTGKHLDTLIGPKRIWSIAYSPDGQTLASGSGDNNIRLWNAHTGEHLDTLIGHAHIVYSIAYSPDGQTLASGSGDNNIRLWNTHTGKHLDTLIGPKRIWSIAYSPDGQTLASGSGDNNIRLWNAHTGEHLDTLIGHAHIVYSIAYSPDGQTLASGSGDNNIRLWNTHTGEHLDTLIGHKSSVFSVAYSPDGQTLASGSGDQTIRLWNAHTGKHLDTLIGHKSSVFSVAYSPDGQMLASGSEDDNIRLWNAHTGKHLDTLIGHKSSVFSVAYSPDGQTLASGSGDRNIHLWNLRVLLPVPEPWQLGETISPQVILPIYNNLSLPHGSEVRCVAYSPRGGLLASGSTNDTIHLWQASTGELLETLDKHTADINSIAFSPNNIWLASGSDDEIVRLWKRSAEIGTWETPQGFRMKGGTINKVKSVAFSYDNAILACGASNNVVYIFDYDLNTNKWIYRQVLKGHSSTVNSVAFSPNSVILASGSDDDTVRLWDAGIGKPLATLKRHTADVNSVVFSSSNTFLASGSDDDTVILWKWDTSMDTWGYHRTLEGHSGDVQSVVFNPTGTVLLSGSTDGTIGVWDGRTGDYQTSLVDHIAGVNSVVFTPHGNAIASGGSDGIVRQLTHTEAMDIADRGIGLTVSSDLISEVAFGPKSTYFVLSAQFPTLTGVADTDAIYRDCKITLDLPGVPEYSLLDHYFQTLVEYVRQEKIGSLINFDLSTQKEIAKHLDLLDVLPDQPQHFIFPLKTAKERSREVEFEADTNLAVVGVSTLAGLIPTVGDLAGLGISVGSVELERALAIDEIVRSTMDPRIHLTNNSSAPGHPSDKARFVVMLPRQAMNIKITVEQKYKLKSKSKKFWFDPTYTETYQGTWNLRDGILAAPSGQLRSLADYPPFQLLSPKVQEYLLRYFDEFMNTRKWRLPMVTSLLPNYPNPFNPETWIPYQLAETADVTLTIYDINGRVVRDLDLGHQRAGMYYSRSRAAYWDGKNALGEPAASGVYFYTLKAGEFMATQKMLIRK